MNVGRKLEDGLAAHRAGRLDEAEAAYKAILEAQPQHADALHFLGLIAYQRGDNQSAVQLIQQALESDWQRPTFHSNLGAAHVAIRDWEAAADDYQRAAEFDPTSLDAFATLGGILGRLGRYGEAEDAFRSALALDRENARVLSGLGAALHRQGHDDEALGICQKAVERDPSLAEAHTNLGNILQSLGRLSEAESAQKAAIAAGSDDALVHYNLGNLYAAMWRLDDGMTCFKRALELDPTDPSAIGNYLLNSLYLARETEESLYRSHLRWSAIPKPARQPRMLVRDKSPNRRLRIGYLSPDFRQHSCAYFAEPLFESHDRGAFEVVAVSTVTQPDDVTARFRALADQWLDISSLTDATAVAQADAAEIDILVDFAGFTRGGRPGVIAARTAPIQGAWLGYPSTMGLPGIDFRLTDNIADPLGTADEFHSEKLYRLPNGFLCYRPPEDAPAVAALPALEAGGITFGSFNNLLKITPEVVDIWARILEEIDGSRLMLKAGTLNYPETRDAVSDAFRARGIEGDRLVLQGWIPRDQNPLLLYNNVDIGLDTFPYNGATTTLEALWMGVPVIALDGTRHAGRVAASILNRVDLGHFVAESADHYVNIARSAAADLHGLAELRQGLRFRIEGSSLRDERGFARDVEQIYRQLWSGWCTK